MTWLIVLPILIPLATAVASLVLWRFGRAQRWLAVGGTGALLAAAVALLAGVWTQGIHAVQAGGWGAPFGISLVADHLSAIMVLVTAVLALATAVYSLGETSRAHGAFGYHALFQVLLVGVNGAFLTGDLFNLYVWFEVLLIASFVLLVLGNRREQIRAAVPYVVISLVSSLCFLSAAGLLYGMTGTLNLAELSVVLGQSDAPGLVTAIAVLFLVAFGIKAAMFPLFFWLPDAYPAAPVAVSAFFGGVLTKVGVYALLRVFTLLFTQDVAYTHTLILVIAGFTMITGVLGAVAQTEFRRLLSFHIVSQIGYLAMGLALFTPLALLGAVFFMVHVILAKSALFLVSGVVHRLQGSFELERLGGLYRTSPWLAAMFLIPALSLAGLPPFSGFWGKLILIRAGLEVEQYLIVGVALGVGLLTLFSMTKIWLQAFWKPAPVLATAGGLGGAAAASGMIGGAGSGGLLFGGGTPGGGSGRRALLTLMAPVALLALLVLGIGLWAEPLVAVAERASAELLNPTLYVNAVLGGAS
jgi:multicomponent Na+:H+ antiporter subunit D